MKTLAFVLMFFFARTVSAQVFISEIMYDPEGGDTAHEWVEIVNKGPVVDLAHSKFVEGGSSHGLSVVQGDATLSTGAYAIIADDAQTFLNDNVGFSGVVIDSVFSLNNTTGETVAFKMPDGTVSDTATYTSDIGGAGDGNSIQKINSAWSAAFPTPGAENNLSVTVSSADTQVATSGGVTSVASTIAEPFDTQMYARITIQSGGTVSGAPIIFTGEAVDSKKKSISDAYYLWAFGDGETGSGKVTSHVFRYPGNYNVVLSVSSKYDIPTVVTRIKILVSPAFLRAMLHDTSSSAVDIVNDSTKDIDLSSWVIEGDYRRFTFPEHTMLLAKSVVTLAPETTGFRAPLSFIRILYPNGSTYEQAPKEIQKDIQAQIVKPVSQVRPQEKVASVLYKQTASVSDAFIPISATTSSQAQKEESLWLWYIGVAFFVSFALLGIRLTQEAGEKTTSTVDDFEIMDDEEPH